jgi:Flp pilus assembly pilin Flp
MSTFEEIITALQDIADKLDDAKTASGSAETDVDDAISQATALGATAVVAGLNSVKTEIDKLSQQISASVDTANEAINRTQAVANGT